MEVGTIRHQLDRLHALLSDASGGDNGSFRHTYEDLISWLAGLGDGASLASFRREADFSSYRERFTDYQRRYLKECESEVARLLLDPASRLDDALAGVFARQTYDRLAEMTSLVDLSHCRRFVMVGCGAFPAAVLFAVKTTPAREIVGLDAHADAARLASDVVRRHGSDRARVIEEDGVRFDYGEADVVYVANQVSPKRGVVAQIAATARPGTTVIVREPFGWGRLLAETGLEPPPPRLTAGAAGAENRHFLSRHHVLLVE